MRDRFRMSEHDRFTMLSGIGMYSPTLMSPPLVKLKTFDTRRRQYRLVRSTLHSYLRSNPSIIF